MAIDLAAIERKIKKLQQLHEFAKDPEMLALLDELSSRNGNSVKSEEMARAIAHQPVVDSGTTLIGTVESIINSGGEHTVPSLVKKLDAMEWKWGTSDKATAVGTAVRRLAERDKILVLREGSGRQPKVYHRLE